jgi:hypothetical protein
MDIKERLRDGATVYGADGDKVGTMRTHGMDYIVVEKGFFFPADYYIPHSAIDMATDDEVYLNVDKDDALNQGWDIAPSGILETDALVVAESESMALESWDRTDSEAESTSAGAYQTHVPGSDASQDDTTGTYEQGWAEPGAVTARKLDDK